MSDNVSIFDQYKVKKSHVDASETDQPQGERGYKAYGIDTPKNRPSLLWIDHVDGMVELLDKGYLVKVICTSHRFLSLLFTHSVYTFEGRHLHLLLEYLQEEKIRSLHCFDPRKHDAPADDEPLITAIEEQSVADFMIKR